MHNINNMCKFQFSYWTDNWTWHKLYFHRAEKQKTCIVLQERDLFHLQTVMKEMQSEAIFLPESLLIVFELGLLSVDTSTPNWALHMFVLFCKLKLCILEEITSFRERQRSVAEQNKLILAGSSFSLQCKMQISCYRSTSWGRQRN